MTVLLSSTCCNAWQRILFASVLLSSIVCGACSAQDKASQAAIPQWVTAAGGAAEFEVASIRSTKPGTFSPPSFPLSNDDSYRSSPGGLFRADFPVRVYISFAYKLSPDEGKLMEASLPPWAKTDAFQIEAKPGIPNPTKDQMRLMMQALLATRFKIAMHAQSQTVPVYFLTPIKAGITGPTLRPHSEGAACDSSTSVQGVGSSGQKSTEFPPVCDTYTMRPGTGGGRMLGARDTTLALLAASLDNVGHVGRPVLDRTALTGTYDFTLTWTPERDTAAQQTPNVSVETTGTTFLQALREQLGMKLESGKEALPVLVVDHIETPSEN